MKRYVVRRDCLDFEDREYVYIVVDTKTKKEFEMNDEEHLEMIVEILNKGGDKWQKKSRNKSRK